MLFKDGGSTTFIVELWEFFGHLSWLLMELVVMEWESMIQLHTTSSISQIDENWIQISYWNHYVILKDEQILKFYFLINKQRPYFG